MAGSRALPDLIARLRLDTSDLQKAEQAVKSMDRQMQSSAGASSASLKRVQQSSADTHSSIIRLGTSFVSTAASVAVGAAAYAGFSGVMSTVAGAMHSTIGAGIDFGDTMNTLQAVSGATNAQLAALQQRSIELGNDLTLPNTSASDAARAMTELAKAGLNVDQTMAAAKGTLQLAAAAGVDEATAATLAATALNAFHLNGSQAGRVADLLAASANASAADIGDMGLAMQQSAASAAQLHIPIQDLVTMLAEMANSGIKGADAGTSVKTMLAALTPNSAAAAAAMKQLGVNAFDLHGNLLPIPAIIDQYNKGLSKLTPQQRQMAIETIFGSDASRAANIILGQSSATFKELEGAVTKVGAAQDVAAAKSKGLGGAIRALQSQLETMSLQIYQQLEPALEGIATKAGQVLPAAFEQAGKLAGGQRNVGQVAMTGLEGAGLSPEAAARIAGPMTDLAQNVLPALEGAFQRAKPALRELGQALLDMVPPLLQIATNISGAVGPAFEQLLPTVTQMAATLSSGLAPILQTIADHLNILVPILGTITAIWAVQQTILLASTVAGWAYTAWIYGYVAATYVVRAATLAWIAVQAVLDVVLTANPIGLVILAIAALIGVIVLVVTHWQLVVTWVRQAWNTFNGFLNALGPFQIVFLAILGPIGLVIGLAKALHDNWSTVIGVFDGVAGAVQSAWRTLQGFAGAAGSLWSTIKNSLPGPAQAALKAAGVPGFAMGGIVPGYAPGQDVVPAFLSPGEAVLRPETVRMLGPVMIDRLNSLPEMSRTGMDSSRSYNVTVNGATMGLLDERRIVSLLRDVEFLYG